VMAYEPASQCIQSLLRPEAFSHPVTEIDVLETHISWVILTGQFAYKIKKPVDLGFLDFTTLRLRKHYCEEEVRLNRRWAPDLYLGVVEVRGSDLSAKIGGGGPIIDYAVKMVQFPQSARLDEQLAAGALDDVDMRSAAKMLATAHRHANIKTLDITESIEKPMQDNFTELAKYHDSTTLQQLKEWTSGELGRLQTMLVYREEHDFIRECHGDLHLANLVRLESGITAFDCVEFSAVLRDIDVMSDVAFLVMDLVAHQRIDLAYKFLNRYLELSGDYGGIELLDLYFVYHCLIRAKIASIRIDNLGDASEARADNDELLHELEVARQFISRPRPTIVAMHGFSASGKTSISGRLMLALPAIRIRSDIERKRIYGYGESEHSKSSVDQGIYTTGASQVVYERLADLTSTIVKSNHTAIVDASFLKLADRKRMLDLAEDLGVTLLVVDTQASHPVLIERLQNRNNCESEVSEADINVLHHQFSAADTLNAGESIKIITVDTETLIDLDQILDEIRDHSN